MRGEVRSRRIPNDKIGITPAHAGRRITALLTSLSAKDHPRACGEKFEWCQALSVHWGSPPRMRGEGAGSTGNHPYTRDHPRACGEKTISANALITVQGSPPRMRGEAADDGVSGVGMGITPAHAGRRTAYGTPCFQLQDHPRACGEKFGLGSTPSWLQGSPPRMRGEVLRT